MNSCNVRNRNVQIVNSISHHTKPLSVGKFDCSCNVSKPVNCKFSNKSVRKIVNNRQLFNLVRESVVVSRSKRARKRSFNVRSHSMVLQNHLM